MAHYANFLLDLTKLWIWIDVSKGFVMSGFANPLLINLIQIYRVYSPHAEKGVLNAFIYKKFGTYLDNTIFK